VIIIVIVRRCFCEIGNHHFDLEWDEEPPKKCKICGSSDWEEAPEIRDATYIRKGITKVKKKLNPGAASGKRQERGKRQWQGVKDKAGNPVKAR